MHLSTDALLLDKRYTYQRDELSSLIVGQPRKGRSHDQGK